MRIPGSEGTKINGARVKGTGTYGSLTLGCVFKSRKTIFFFFYFFLLSLMGANSLLNDVSTREGQEKDSALRVFEY